MMGELRVTSAKGWPGVGLVGSSLSCIGGPGKGAGGHCEPQALLVGTQPAEHSRDLGEGDPAITSGSPVGRTRCGSRPVEGAGPSPAVTRTPEAAALQAFLLGGWAALMEGPHAPACCPRAAPG